MSALFYWVEPCRVKSSTPTVCTLSVEAPGNKIFHISTTMFKNPELFSLPSLTIALRPPDLPNLFRHSVISLAEGGSRVEISNLQRNLTGKKCSTSFSPEDHLVAFHSPPISLKEPKTTVYLGGRRKIKAGSTQVWGPQSITINLSGIYRIGVEQHSPAEAEERLSPRVQRRFPAVAITFPAVNSHREHPWAEEGQLPEHLI